MLSINTNSASDTAVRIANIIQRDQEETNNRISTGLKVKEAQDNSAAFQIALQMNADVAAIDAGLQTQSLARATTAVAEKAGSLIADQLTSLKSQAVLLQAGGLDDASRQAIQNDISSTVGQIGDLAGSASFNGINLLESGQSVGAVKGADGSTTSVEGQGFTPADLGLDNLDFSNPDSILSSVNSAIDDAGAKLATFGAKQNELENLEDFSGALRDSIKEGVGTLVDANLGEEAARNSANQIAGQLNAVSINIANASGRAIGSLF